MSDLSSSDAKQKDSTDSIVYDPAKGWTVLSALIIVLALVQFGFSIRRPPQLEVPRFQVDLNRASEAELLALPELGPQTTRRIVQYREQHGRFENVDDLRRVPGIGPATMRTLRPMVTVSEAEKADELSRNSSTSSKDGRSYAQR